MSDKKKKSEFSQDLAYYLTMFTLEGHRTWRVNLHPQKEGFDLARSKETNPPKLTAVRKFRIDRITGSIDVIE